MSEDNDIPYINSGYVADLLADMRRLDPEATEKILAIKVPVNKKLRAHPTIHFYDDQLTVFGAIAGMTSDTVPRLTDKALRESIIKFFNQILELDPDAIKKLIWERVNINWELAQHPDLFVLVEGDENGNPINPRVGLLGILNGLTGSHDTGWGHVGAEFDEEGNLLRFLVPPNVEEAEKEAYEYNTDSSSEEV